ncbi:MAG TPA: acyl carrier protein [Bacteroidales bacterium]|jgi:acyl carrier protein|nr:acyl carrier protein [Bacteroidales bacterium]HOS72490.1 acyl carrier protein [Bacteroidales bacterium]HQH25359.1 acyl carrier protein [Bacteroidales bacterium]HQJ82973.1 acyl carrier protein [Bacteroidales bacterium]
MAYDQTVIQEKIRQYIVEASHVDKEKIKDESLLFKEGYFDSMGFILLITFLEEEFKIKTSDSDLLEENFESINAMTGFVVNKLLS